MMHLPLILLSCFFITFTARTEYEHTIEQQALTWKISYASMIDQEQHIQTLIDVILLSYQIAKESCIMTLAKLVIQEELLKIYTPSLSDSWQTNMQSINNDTSILESAITSIKKSQTKVQEMFSRLKQIGSRLIKINPQPTQTLIHDLKDSLITWGKQQHEIPEQLSIVQEEFSIAIATISDIKSIFNTITSTPDCKHCHLKEAAGHVAKTYKDIESVIAHVTSIRRENTLQIQRFFSLFFKAYYRTLYDQLTQQQQITLITLATDTGKLPSPDAFFR